MGNSIIQSYKEKLKSNRGLTIVFALTTFMITCLISLVIVSNALHNVKRIKRQKNAQQMNLAISSAATYVEKLFDGCRAVCYTPLDGSAAWWEYDDNQQLDRLVHADNTAFQTQYRSLIENGQQISWQICPDSDNNAIKDALWVVLDVERDGDDLIASLSNTKKNSDGDVRTGRYSMSFLFTAEKYTESDKVQRPDENGRKAGKKLNCQCTVYQWKYSSLVR